MANEAVGIHSGHHHVPDGGADATLPRPILLVADRTPATSDLASLLQRADYRIVGPFDSVERAAAAAGADAPHLAVIDLRAIAPSVGLLIATALWRRYLLASVVVGQVTSERQLAQAVGAGAIGCVVTPFDERQLIATVTLARLWSQASQHRWREAWHQRTIVDAYDRIASAVHSADALLAHARDDAEFAKGPAISLDSLSARENDVLRLLLGNYRVRAISDALFISPHTVRNHLKSIYRKVGVGSQAELIEWARRPGASSP